MVKAAYLSSNPSSVQENQESFLNSAVLYIYIYQAYKESNTHRQPRFLTPQRLDVINLLYSLCSQYKRMLFLYTNAIFDADAHAAEVGRVGFCVGNVEAALTRSISGA